MYEIRKCSQDKNRILNLRYIIKYECMYNAKLDS